MDNDYISHTQNWSLQNNDAIRYVLKLKLFVSGIAAGLSKERVEQKLQGLYFVNCFYVFCKLTCKVMREKTPWKI